LDTESGDEQDLPGVDEAVEAAAELSAGGELVGIPAAVGAVRGGGADGPEDLGPGRCAGELDEGQDGVGGGVPSADDEGAASGEPVPGDLGQRSAARAWSSPTAGRPEPPSGAGAPQVPEASMTALARTSPVPPSSSWMRRRKGAWSRPRLLPLSRPCRVTAVTRVLSRMRGASSGVAARGSR
jgi:hypothetical protein